MNRTELAQYIAGGYNNDTYKILILMFNKVTDKQMTEFEQIAKEIKND
jgi:hypothetical protein